MKLSVLALFLTAVMMASSVYGQPTPKEGSVLVRINGNLTTTPDEENDAVILINGEGHIAGTARVVVLINGTALLSGARVEELVVVSGQARLVEGTVVVGDVHLLNGDVFFEGGSLIQGTIHREQLYRIGRGLLVFGIIFGIGYGIAVVLGGVAAAAVAPSGLRRAGAALTSDPVSVILATLILWVALPLLAIATLFTIIGIPTGLAVLLFLLPALGFLGYLVTGIRLGDAIIGRIRGSTEAEHPYAAAIVGLTLLVLLGWLPVLGAILTPVASLLGSGALAFTLWQARRQEPAERTALAG